MRGRKIRLIEPMQTRITINDFHKTYQKRLKLSFLSSQAGLEREIRLPDDDDDHFELADYLNVIRPASIVVIGQRESAYLASLNVKQRDSLMHKLCDSHVTMLILSRNASLSIDDIRGCRDARITSTLR